jgi:hypothetical protein
MDIASFLFGIALGLTIGGLVAWLAGLVTTARILARLDAERQGSAEKLALLVGGGLSSRPREHEGEGSGCLTSEA